MLHAELRGKLSSDVGTDVERSEDVLTSTVFGTLFAVGALDIVAEWFSRARRGTTAAPPVDVLAPDTRYWFWPQLDRAEPDLVVLAGRSIVVVEAKYLSSKSGPSSVVESEKPHDQLVREWLAVTSTASTTGYDPELRDAVTDPSSRRLLLYLVRRSRLASELAELEQSLLLVPDAAMYLLTWEDLDEVLATRLHVRWASELHQYLRRRQLAAFRGFRSTMARASSPLKSWAAHRPPTRPRFSDLLSAVPSVTILARRPSAFVSRRSWSECLSAESVERVQNLAQRTSPFMEP